MIAITVSGRRTHGSEKNRKRELHKLIAEEAQRIETARDLSRPWNSVGKRTTPSSGERTSSLVCVRRLARKLKAIDVIDVLSDLFILRGVPGHIRSDNGPEFVAKAVQEWITAVGAKTLHLDHPMGSHQSQSVEVRVIGPVMVND